MNSTIYEKEFNAVLPGFSGFRQYKIKNSKGIWKNIPRKITSANSLLKEIIKSDAVDVYYTASKWLNPSKLRVKGNSGTYVVADNILLGWDLILDFDCVGKPTYESLDKAKQVAIAFDRVMREFSHSFNFQYFAFTGQKGWRLCYSEFKSDLPEDALKRIIYAEQKRNLFISELKQIIKKDYGEESIEGRMEEFDIDTATNIMNVFRVPGTYHSKTGFESQLIPINSISKTSENLLSTIRCCVHAERPVILAREMIENDDLVSSRPRHYKQEKDVPGLASFSTLYYYTNQVLGTNNNYVPVFIYGKEFKHQIKKLQKKYSLGDLYVFKYKENFVYISLKLMQKRQLLKVLKESKSFTYNTFKKNNTVWIPLAMKFEKVIVSKSGLRGQASKAHDIVYGELGNSGNGKLKMIVAKVNNG